MAAGTARTLIEPGQPDTPGSAARDGGTLFAVFAPDAAGVELCLFDAAGYESTRLDLFATDGTWHGFVPDIGVGQRYGLRAHGAYDPARGLRFNPHKLLLDPYATRLSGAFRWHDAVFDYERSTAVGPLVPSTLDSADCVPKCVVTARQPVVARQWRPPPESRLIYELNVRGFTMRHPAIDESLRGRFDALGHPAILQHLRALGVTSVELMPVHAFVDEEFLVARGLRNYWGYNTLSFFAPAPRYLGDAGIDGLRGAIEALHAHNIEVIVDVVYNHTAEGGSPGPTLSLRGLANDRYYRLMPDDRAEYVNDSGCGNTLNVDEPVTRRLIIDSLRHWVAYYGVDGFRFDLATILGRTAAGFDRGHALFTEIAQDPVLANVSLIAEPWDVGPGGYQLGAFPAGWAEWNDRFRDTVRAFWRGDAGLAPELARRTHGSADIFEPGGRGPAASVNFVASHDGFTTADLVSFAERHNEANGEHNRDGHAHNFSCNHGVEGPTGDPAILAARRRHRLNLLASVLLAQGTPMLLAGDEFGHSQGGNNNAYAQDNETGWLDWTGLDRDPEFFAAVREIVQLRRAQPLLRQPAYRHGEPSTLAGRLNIEWCGADGLPLTADQWATVRALGMLLVRPQSEPALAAEAAEAAISGSVAVCVLFNAGDVDVDFVLPVLPADGAWVARFTSADTVPRNPAAGGATAGTDAAGARWRLAGGSLACLSYD